MTAYNPDEVEQLIAEAREDDARMTRAPWNVDGKTGIMYGDYRSDEGAIDIAIVVRKEAAYDVDAIARTRNNLAVLADQLEAARLEIDRLQHANASLIPGAMLTTTEIACLRVERDGSRADVLRLTETARAACENWMSACKQRDEAKAEIGRMRPVVKAAEEWTDRALPNDSNLPNDS